ncbi:hypothetical protein AVEN_190390-1, partial [Araneus ventricosus]
MSVRTTTQGGTTYSGDSTSDYEGKWVDDVIIPTCMSFITFWIPAEAYPARVTLAVTSLLTIVTQQYQSAMPSVSYVVALNIWMLSYIGFVFCSLLEYTFVVSVMNNKGTDMWPVRKFKVSQELSFSLLSLAILTSRFEATRGIFWNRPHKFEPRSDNENDTGDGTPLSKLPRHTNG